MDTMATRYAYTYTHERNGHEGNKVAFVSRHWESVMAARNKQFSRLSLYGRLSLRGGKGNSRWNGRKYSLSKGRISCKRQTRTFKRIRSLLSAERSIHVRMRFLINITWSDRVTFNQFLRSTSLLSNFSILLRKYTSNVQSIKKTNYFHEFICHEWFAMTNNSKFTDKIKE